MAMASISYQEKRMPFTVKTYKILKINLDKL
jgi:hypothetical protein